jgi:hypothetical protein
MGMSRLDSIHWSSHIGTTVKITALATVTSYPILTEGILIRHIKLLRQSQLIHQIVRGCPCRTDWGALV